MMCIFTPGLVGPEYFRELAAAISNVAGSSDIAADLGAIMTRYGVIPSTILPPAEDLSIAPPRSQVALQSLLDRIDS